MKAGRRRQQLRAGFEDDFEVISVKFLELTAQAKEENEELVWIEDQTSYRNIFRIKTTVVIGLAAFMVTFLSAWW